MKNFFSYFTNVKVLAVMLVFGIFAGTAGYVFAQSMRSNVHRPSNLASGTVNVTPNGSTNVDANTARVSYIVSYADMKSSDGSQSANRLNVLVPRAATNVNFTLIGTIEKPETPFMTDDGKYTEKPVNVNLPLVMGTNSDPLVEQHNLGYIYPESIKMPTGEEINAGNANAAVVVDRGIASNSRLYTLPALHSSHPAAVKVEFDIAKNSQESHIPLRAYKPLHCLLEVCDSLWTYRTEIDILPEIADIASGDFDNHGLYLDSSKCSVTRNLSRWDKIGADITPLVFNYVSTFNLHLNPAVNYYGVTESEDLCDQAAVTISAR